VVQDYLLVQQAQGVLVFQVYRMIQAIRVFQQYLEFQWIQLLQ
jgi:hypothetical protein